MDDDTYTHTHKYEAFMAHIPETSWKDVVSHLTARFPDRKYLVVGEKKPYDHMHFLIEMTKKEYRNYVNSVFRQKYQLRGKVTKIDGKNYCKQYGKIKEIRDVERLQAYMIKDNLDYGKYTWTNLSKDKLKLLKETISHSKDPEKPYKKYIRYLKANDVSVWRTHGQLEVKILTLKILAETWLQVTKARLPSKDTLIYYAYCSGRLEAATYIKHKYNENFIDDSL